jgi:transcription antitermination factor NusG
MEVKNGARKMVKRNIYPGYVLVRMDLTDESWSANIMDGWMDGWINVL